MKSSIVLGVLISAAASANSEVSYSCYLNHLGKVKEAAVCDLKAYEGSPDPSERERSMPLKDGTGSETAFFRVIQEAKGSAIEYAWVPAGQSADAPFVNRSGKNIIGKVYPGIYGGEILLKKGLTKIDGYSFLDSASSTKLEDDSKITIRCATSMMQGK